MSTLWRSAFNMVERPLGSLAESWVQSDAFMDVLAVAVKAQRQAAAELRRVSAPWMELWGIPTRTDVHKLANQVASLERVVRQLALDVEARGERRDERQEADSLI